MNELLESAKMVVKGFEAGVFVRDIRHDHDSDWGVRAFPYLLALAKLMAAIDTEENKK